jgi:hypothetical protein
VGDQLVLFASGSDGTVEQWNGSPTVRGLILRWLQAAHVGFPDYGYDLSEGKSRPNSGGGRTAILRWCLSSFR